MLNIFMISYSLQGEKSIRALSRVFADYRLRQPKHQRIKATGMPNINKTAIFSYSIFKFGIFSSIIRIIYG